MQTATAYLEALNPEQRRAVEHGAAGASAAPPLLVIAGAGSGKTNTLAHRVAHLIVQGADPRRILLMTFSRRAASEMTKRVERIARKVMGAGAGVMTDALTWAGTYHGIGARLLREHAERIGLDPAFTIHDREDSADLMNLVRHEKGFSRTESRFPTKGTCLSIYSRCVNAEMPVEQVIGTSYPWCAGWAAELKELFAAYVEAKQKQNVLDYDDLLLYWAQMVGDATLADDIGGRFDHVLVDEYRRLEPQRTRAPVGRPAEERDAPFQTSAPPGSFAILAARRRAGRIATRPADLKTFMISISTAGSMRSPVIVVGRFALKFARNARGRASNLYEATLYRSVSSTRRALLCPVLWVSQRGTVQIMRAAKPLSDMMSLDEYMHVTEVWDYVPGENSCPFEPKASDWGWFEGRMVALDYSTPAWEADEPISA